MPFSVFLLKYVSPVYVSFNFTFGKKPADLDDWILKESVTFYNFWTWRQELNLIDAGIYFEGALVPDRFNSNEQGGTNPLWFGWNGKFVPKMRGLS